MRPFNPDPITDRSRELFGTYMRRYETEPSMSAFDAPISDRKRELYGAYQSRWSTIKKARYTAEFTDANGLNWVTVGDPGGQLSPTINDIAIYQVWFSVGGGWAGTAQFRILVNDVKVYPFWAAEEVIDGKWTFLGSLSVNIRVGDTGILQIRSTDAGDVGAGFDIMSSAGYTEFRPYV